jgi:hypothetical protein
VAGEDDLDEESEDVEPFDDDVAEPSEEPLVEEVPLDEESEALLEESSDPLAPARLSVR